MNRPSDRAFWGLWLALGALWLVFGLPALTKTLTENLSLAHPGWLWALAALWLLPAMMWRTLNDLPAWQRAVQLLVRAAVLSALVIAIATPQRETTDAVGSQVIHLVDVSRSMPDASLREIGAKIDESLKGLKRGDDGLWRPASGHDVQVDVVAFAGEAARLPWPVTATELTASQVLQAHHNLIETNDQSDLEGAVNVALALSSPSRVTHLVVWSDGVETRGDIAALRERLRRAGVQVHRPSSWRALAAGEFVVERIVLPAKVRANVPFPVSVDVHTSGAVKLKCEVKGNGDTPEPSDHAVEPGRARLELGRAKFRSAGVSQLTVECAVRSGRDRFANNNRIRGRVVVTQRPRVLYIEGARGQSLYLSRALSDDYEVIVRGPQEVPRTTKALKRYGAVILSDVARITPAGVPQLTIQEMRALEGYVRDGGGLLVVGGENSLGSGGYQGTYLDKHVLPVRMDVDSATEQPSVALMLCVDRSGSMSGVKMELAKEAARATAEALAHEDRIGVITFDNIARTAVRLQRAGNRFRIASRIRRINAGGGTHIYPALQQAYQALERIEAKVKHVILLSDGHASRSGIDALVAQMRRSAITVTTVGIGAQVDRDLLEAIADRGGGRSYFTDRPETLPRIFVRETRKIAGESVIERRVRARRAPGSGRVDLLRGVPLKSAPPLLGFVDSKVKPGAEELLRLSSGDPLLVRWRLGLGRVSVWTSDLKNRWAHRWIDWGGYAVLVRQMVRDLLQEHMGLSLDVQLVRERDHIRLGVDARDETGHWLTGLRGEARWTLPDGEQQRTSLQEIAPGRYEGRNPMRQLGAYDVKVSLTATDSDRALAEGSATVVHPYPEEYRLASGAKPIDGVCAHTGGGVNSTPKRWHNNQGRSIQRTQERWAPWVWLAIALFLLDLTLRRVRLGPSRALSWYR